MTDQTKNVQKQMTVVCPPNAYPGAFLSLTTPPPDVHAIKVQVPSNVFPGMAFKVQYCSYGPNERALQHGGGIMNNSLMPDDEKMAIELKLRRKKR